jgi:hypothetical protein
VGGRKEGGSIETWFKSASYGVLWIAEIVNTIKRTDSLVFQTATLTDLENMLKALESLCFKYRGYNCATKTHNALHKNIYYTPYIGYYTTIYYTSHIL